MSDTPKEERLYAVMTDSPRAFSKTVLARVKPHASKETGFWTDVDTRSVWLMNRETASEILSKLGHNNPRMVRAEKALAIIEGQMEAGRVPAEDPFDAENESGPTTGM